MLQASFDSAEKLNSLLGEINTLATQCKQARPPFQTNSDGAGGLRGVLLVLGRNDGSTVPEIARRRCTSRQNIQIVVNRLREEGLAELINNPSHKRSALVRLTEKGMNLFQQIELAEAKLLSDVLADLSQDELVSTAKCLHKLRQALSSESSHYESVQTLPSVHNEINQNQPRAAVQRPRRPSARIEEENTSDNDPFPVNLL